MMKPYKWHIVFSVAMVILPAAIGICLLLSGAFRSSAGTDGMAASVAASRLKLMIFTSLFLLADHCAVIWFTFRDPANRKQNPKMISFIFWICPLVSVFSCGIIYQLLRGDSFNHSMLLVFLALLFIIFGNYMPKTSPNRTVGIRVPWTLADEENWNATHRFGGKVWVAGGLLLLAAMFLPESVSEAVVPSAILLIALAPILYSYVYYRRKRKAGEDSRAADSEPAGKVESAAGKDESATVKSESAAVKSELAAGGCETVSGCQREGLLTDAGQAKEKAAGRKSIYAVSVGSALILIVILAATAILMFTGDIRVTYTDESFTITASYWDDLTVAYDEIESVELRENGVSGMRTFGFGSARLGMGTFENDEFGSYTRYTYTGSRPCVVLTAGGGKLVINGRDPAATQEIYEHLKNAAAKQADQ